MNKLEAAAQLRRALQMFVNSLNDEQAMEVPYVFDAWKVGKAYTIDDLVAYGTNDVGDPQLYRVVTTHVSQSDWAPNITPALYTPIGLDNGGHPIWAQPTGAHDAYNKGDIVNYNGTLYKSLIDGNIWAPDAYPAGWEVYNA